MLEFMKVEYARELMDDSKNLNEAIKFINNEITKAASSNKNSITIRKFGFEVPANFYCASSRMPKLNIEIIDGLRQSGFTVEMKTEERQFVDCYLLVTW